MLPSSILSYYHIEVIVDLQKIWFSFYRLKSCICTTVHTWKYMWLVWFFANPKYQEYKFHDLCCNKSKPA